MQKLLIKIVNNRLYIFSFVFDMIFCLIQAVYHILRKLPHVFTVEIAFQKVRSQNTLLFKVLLLVYDPIDPLKKLVSFDFFKLPLTS